MKTTHSTRSVPNGYADYRPNRVRALFRATKAQLDISEGREVPYEDLARYAGQAASSVFDKLQKTAHPQVEALLGWLERLPEPTRNQLIDSVCRCFPKLENTRLAHDLAQVSRLKTLLRKPDGITVIQGDSDELRTFVLTALGHSHEIFELGGGVCGIDVHEPDWFVPLPSVIYLHNLLEPARLKEYVYRIWPTISRRVAHLVVLNGVWGALQPLEGELQELALRSHVIITDDPCIMAARPFRGPLKTMHVLRVSEETDNHIQVTIQKG